MDEPDTQLVSPSASVQAVQYSFGSQPAISLVTASPLLCANTSTPISSALINATYYSANGSAGPSPAPFVFGASSATPTVSASAAGATLIGYNGDTVQFSGDSTLVCYELDANGAHKTTRNLFTDGFEAPGTDVGLLGNSSVTLSVLRAPGLNGYLGNEYDYYVDAYLPTLPGNCSTGLDCNFVLVEGYDTSLFDTTGKWCKDDGSNATNPGNCNGAWNSGDINVNTSSGTLKLAAGHNYFAVQRYAKSGITSLPSAPVAVASLFSPLDLEENTLDDNVATGNNTLANVAPSVVQDSTFSALAFALTNLHESTDSGALTFNITDTDSVESSGNLLSAAVTLNLPNGIQVPVVADCGPTTPITTLPVNRTCTIAIPLSNDVFWDSFVPTQYQRQFNNVATDVANGVYAGGVSANAQIVVTDAIGKASAPNSLLLHINSSKNDAPEATFVNVSQWHAATDPLQGNASYQTYVCSVAAGNCVSSGHQFNVVDLVGALTVQPGPVAAFDELAAQTTTINDVQCGQLGEASAIFLNAPVITATTNTPGSFDITFQLEANSDHLGSSLCKATFADAMAGASPPPFPNSEAAVTTDVYFRVVVTQ